MTSGTVIPVDTRSFIGLAIQEHSTQNLSHQMPLRQILRLRATQHLTKLGWQPLPELEMDR